MADEKLPKPDKNAPGTPTSRSMPTFSQDVIYAGAPVSAPRTDATSQAPASARTDAISPVAPPPPSPRSEPAPKTIAKAGDGPLRSEIDLFFSWMAGVFLILSCGWGFIALACFVERWLHLNIPIEIALGIGGLGSLGLFFLLQRNLWLSRFMGLRLGPQSSQLTETLYFFFTGIVGLLLRSSDKPAVVASRPQENDGIREVVETVVFVVVLVLLLKTFLVEAFVIPTGSMADTLLGYHREFPCEKCGYKFVVNSSSEAEPGMGRNSEPVVGGICPNCRAQNTRK